MSVLFWLAYFTYEWLGQAAIACEYYRYWINACVIVPITLVATWFTIQILIKKYFLKKRITQFWIGFIVSAIVFTFLRRAFNYYYTYPLYYPQGQSMSFLFPAQVVIEIVNI